MKLENFIMYKRTCVDEDGTRFEILMSLNNAHFNGGNNGVKRLRYEAKWSYRVNYVLHVTSWTSMSVSPTYGNIILGVQVPKSTIV